MTAAINAFSYGNILWARLTGHVLNFRYRGLSDDIHFSIAFNPGSPDINLHISRNIHHPAGKPRIEIVRMNKEELSSLAPVLLQTLLGLLLSPLSIKSSPRRSARGRSGVSFLSFDRFGPGSDHPLQKIILDTVLPVTRTRNKVFKVLPEAETRMEALARSPQYLEMVNEHLQWLRPGQYPTGNTFGFLISPAFIGCAICHNRQWYAIREDVDLLQGLYALLDPMIVADIIQKIQTAIPVVSQAESALDTESFNDPIILYKR